MLFAAARSGNPPGPTGRRLLGSLLEIRKDRIRFVTEATREFGDVVSFTMGPRRIYLLRHPDHIRRVLVDNHQNYQKGLGLRHAKELLGAGLLTSEGPQWIRQRKDIAPIFANEANLQRFAGRVSELAEHRFAQWPANQPIDVARETVLLGISIVGQAMLGCYLDDVATQIADDLDVITTDAMNRMTAALPGPWQRMSRRARASLRRLDRLVQDRVSVNSSACFPGLIEGAQADEREMRDQVLTLLLAGHETTASTLAWALHLLAQHPEAQHQCREEIERVLDGRPPELADLPKLTYTAMVLHETMRLYPPVWLLPRRSLAADTIGAYNIPANSDVLLSMYSLHRHPDFWPSPDSFLPDRFARGVPNRAYLPFGAGPRLCVGRRAGVIETTGALIAAIRRFHFRPAPDRPVRMCASLTLHPDSGLWLEAVPRLPRSLPVALRQVGKPGEE